MTINDPDTTVIVPCDEALSNYKNLPLAQVEPAGHGIGRSRGGWMTKIHHAVDGSGRPLAVVVTDEQRNGGPAFVSQVARYHGMGNMMNETEVRSMRQARDEVAAAQRRLAELVLYARESGATWAEIGRALGISRQAVQQRYSV
ncbi:hypothetical protein BH10ACT6_BH10ACT6_01200 [soil metagenome]